MFCGRTRVFDDSPDRAGLCHHRGDLREAVSPSKETYRRLLTEKLLNKRTCILAFRNEPYESEQARSQRWG